MSSVDVVVPCYRYGHFLRQCVQSVLTQSGTNVRALIIDDASPDDTAEVAADLARQDSRVSFIRHAVNKGHISTYNEGIEWARATYMLILSADDYLLPGALSRAASLMDSHPEVGFTFGNVVVLNEENLSEHRTMLAKSADEVGWRIVSGPAYIELSGARDLVATPTAVVRTQLQKRLGGYRSELPHSGDMEMWLRFAAYGSVGILNAYQAVYRRHDANMTLAYTADSWLGDLQQRKAAFDCFFQTCSGVLPSAQRLRGKLYLLLARDALSFASAAFNENKMEASRQISEFALGLCPKVKGSLPWIKLACKRSMGLRAWRALRPLLRGFSL